MGYVFLENFERIGRIDPDGYIYSEGLERIGKIDKDGRIYDEGFNYVGRIDKNGYIYLSNMKRIGKIEKDGYVYDELFNRVGKLDKDVVNYILGQSSSNNQVRETKANDSNRPCDTPSSTGSFSCGAVLGILVAGGLFIYFVLYSMGPIIGGWLTSDMKYVLGVITLIGALIGLYFKSDSLQFYFIIDYIMLMILYVFTTFSVDSYNAFAVAILGTISVAVGLVHMAVLNIIVAGLSCALCGLIKEMLKNKITTYIFWLILGLISFLIIRYFWENGFSGFREMISEIDYF